MAPTSSGATVTTSVVSSERNEPSVFFSAMLRSLAAAVAAAVGVGVDVARRYNVKWLAASNENESWHTHARTSRRASEWDDSRTVTTTINNSSRPTPTVMGIARRASRWISAREDRFSRSQFIGMVGGGLIHMDMMMAGEWYSC